MVSGEFYQSIDLSDYHYCNCLILDLYGKLGGWAERSSRPEVLARNNFHRGNEYFKEGDFKSAIKHYRHALDKLKNKGHHEHYLMPTALSNIACLDFAEGRVDDAEKLLGEVVEIVKALTIQQQQQQQQHDESEEKDATTVGRGNLDLLEPHNSLKSVMMTINRSTNLLNLREVQETLMPRLEEHTSVDSILGDVLNNIAASYEFIGNLEDAKTFYEEALKIRKIVYGYEHTKVGESLQNLGTVYDKVGQLHEAKTLYEEALSIFLNTQGMQSKDVAMVYSNLGLLYNALNMLDDAELNLKKSLAIRELNVAFGDANEIKATRANIQYVLNKKDSITKARMACPDSTALCGFGPSQMSPTFYDNNHLNNANIET